jgi:hypothetical protein
MRNAKMIDYEYDMQSGRITGFQPDKLDSWESDQTRWGRVNYRTRMTLKFKPLVIIWMWIIFKMRYVCFNNLSDEN